MWVHSPYSYAISDAEAEKRIPVIFFFVEIPHQRVAYFVNRNWQIRELMDNVKVWHSVWPTIDDIEDCFRVL